MPNTMIFAVTMVLPTGVPYKIEIKIPEQAQNTETITDEIITALKL